MPVGVASEWLYGPTATRSRCPAVPLYPAGGHAGTRLPNGDHWQGGASAKAAENFAKEPTMRSSQTILRAQGFRTADARREHADRRLWRT